MTTHHRCAAATIILTIALLSLTAVAQDSAPDDALSQQWDDFVHYITIARSDLAASYGRAILDSDAQPSDIYSLAVATTNVELVLGRGENMNAEMADIVRSVRLVIENGYQQMRADPVGIADAIQRLVGSARAQINARDRLLQSGEYAVPQLLLTLMADGVSPRLRTAIIDFLPKLGRDGVRPLSVALQTDDVELQEILAYALGEIGYPHAVPRLRELLDGDILLPRTREVVERAIVSCSGQAALQKPLAELYYDLAVGYYDRNESLQADSRYARANIWYFRPTTDAAFLQVPREIFCDIYAMRMARLALQHDPNYYPAVSLWLAAGIRKEADLPSGETDPTRGEDQPAAAYYIRAAGAQYAQQVLQRALEDFDSRVAIPAIGALVDTAGAQNLLLTTPGGVQPLVQALTYPDRHVRYRAALSLANALPQDEFEGDDLVITVLNEALRQTGQRTALIIVDDEERRNQLKDAARAAGYDVIDNTDPAKAIVAGYEVGGVDVVIISSDPQPNEVMGMLRREGAFAAVPIIVAAMSNDSLRELAESDGRTVLMGQEVTEEAFGIALQQAGELTTGAAMTRSERDQWAVKAAQAIHTLGLTGCETFDLERTRPMLIGALMVETDQVRVAAAKALAVLSSVQAQQSIVALVADRFAEDPTRIAGLVALAESVRRYGNQLDQPQAEVILGIVTGDGSQPLREAAAQALGAMDLPSDQIKPLILVTEGND